MNKQKCQRNKSMPREWFSLFAVALLVLSSLTVGQARPSFRVGSGTDETASTATVEGRLAVFDDAWQTILNRYYDPNLNGVDWEQQREIFRSQAANAADGPGLYVVLRKLLASLNDVHTRVYAADEKFDWWKPKVISIGLSVREVDGLPVVVHLDKGSAPQRAGIKVGDIIESVNGKPALDLISEKLQQQFPRSTLEPTHLRAFASLLEGAPNTGVEIRWQRRDRVIKEAHFERSWHSRQLGLQVRREGKYVVAQIDAFTPSIALDFTRAMKKALPGARGVILDLRGNGGGEAEAMADVASTFLGEGVDLGTFTDRWKVSFSIQTRAKSLLAAEPLTQTKLPLVVLVSERTSSAAEIFVAAVSSLERGTVIGTKTCGCVLAVRNQHTLPDGGVLDVSELDYRTSKGNRLQDRGLEPDEVVIPTREDLYAKRDRVLNRAVQMISRNKTAHL